jgi:phospholipid transport system substrate-binding protein
MSFKKISRFCCAVFFSWMSMCVYADTTPVVNPVTLIQSTVDSLQGQIKAGGAGLANNPQKLYGIIQKTVMPIVNIDQMAGLALGPKWRQATPAQQQQFVDDFGLLLTRAYANALLTVTDYKLTLNPMRGNAWQTQQYVAVTGQVTSLTTSQSSNLTYYLERSGNSWQIYDLAIEGVSFLKNYQTQFSALPDMPTLLSKLQVLNNNATTGSAAQ